MPKAFLPKIRPALRRKSRLRIVFHLGTIMEQQAETFYRSFAVDTSHNQIRALCQKLADEEKEHLRLIQNKLSRWKSLQINQDDLKKHNVDSGLSRLFLSPPSRCATVEKFIEYAIDQEKKMVSFYEKFENDFTNSWKLKRLIELINEEKEHVDIWSQISKKV
jgi:rubrerythrin